MGKDIKRFQNRPDLQKDLGAKGVSTKGVKDELQALCKNKCIPFKGEALDTVKEGWEGKAKGMLQIPLGEGLH